MQGVPLAQLASQPSAREAVGSPCAGASSSAKAPPGGPHPMRTPPVPAPSQLTITFIACPALIVGFLALMAMLTHGFEAWTYEERRRRDAGAGQLQAPPLVLRDAEGNSRRLFDGDERSTPVHLVDFVYTRCPGVCQALGSEYFRMQEKLKETGAAVRLLSISIDPVHDDQTALFAHGRLHRADPALWAVTAPQNAEHGMQARRQLGIVAIPDGFGGFVHNGSIHVIDGAGRVHHIFDHEQWPQALAAAQQIAPRTQP